MTREQWLTKAIGILHKVLFKPKGYTIPNVRVSVGLPYGRGAKNVLGQHFDPKCSTDGLSAIFISPTTDDTERVLDILVHELIHAVVGTKAGHGPIFRKCAIAVGLEGKMRSTTASGELKLFFKKKLIPKIGKYPHARMSIEEFRKKKQTTRLIKMVCLEHGYIVRSSMSSIVEFGAVLCPVCLETMDVEFK